MAKMYVLFLLFCLLGACSSYTREPLGDNVYKLSVNQRVPLHSQEKIQHFLLVRAAETTIIAGDRYFIFLKKEKSDNDLLDAVIIKTFVAQPKMPGVYDAEAVYNNSAGYRAVKKLHKKLIVSGMQKKPS